jgi:hypothetical protein
MIIQFRCIRCKFCDSWHNQKLPCDILIEFWIIIIIIIIITYIGG